MVNVLGFWWTTESVSQLLNSAIVNTKAVIDSPSMNECVCSRKTSFTKIASQICPLGHSVPTLDLEGHLMVSS